MFINTLECRTIPFVIQTYLLFQGEKFVLWFINTPSSASFVMKIIHNVVLKERNEFSFDEQITKAEHIFASYFFEEWTGDKRTPFPPPLKFQHFQDLYVFKNMQ